MSKKNEEVKRVHFYTTKDKHIRFKAALEKYQMSGSEFLRACCDAMCDDDETMSKFIEEYRIKSENHSKRNINIQTKDSKKGKDLLNDFGLSEDDIEDLFDLISEQYPEI